MTIHRLLPLLFGLALAPAAVVATPDGAAIADETDGSNWLSYGRTYSEQRYSPLDQVNAGNVENLALDWSVELPDARQIVATPLVVDGVIYFTSSFNVVWAVDAREHKVLWTFDPKVPERVGKLLRILWGTSRGLAYWNGKVYVGTGDGRLIALDAASGREVWTTQTTDPRSVYYITGAPRAFNGKVIIGNGGAEFGPVRGYVTAYDAETGEQAWRWWTVPGNPADGFENEAMKMAAETWTGEWWKHGGGGTVWNSMTYDPEFNSVYLGTGNGAPWNQKVRSPGGGDNLFLCSIVALDADTGEYQWHYQTVPGETWDFNSAMDIVLADLAINDKVFKVLMHAPKNGFFYVLNRANGELLSAEKFAKVTWAEKVDLKSGRPVEVAGARYLTEEITMWPGPLGAHNWQPMSYSPKTGLVYLPFHDLPGYYNDDEIRPAEWKHDEYAFRVGVAGYHDDFPADIATSGLMGWDPLTRQPKWKNANPGMWNAGTMATAGNLVFQGRADGNFKAYDATTGEELWTFQTGLGISASPVTFMLDGSQYVAIAVGWGGAVAELGGSLGAQHGWVYGHQPRRMLVFSLEGQAQLPPTAPPTLVTPIDDPTFEIDPKRVADGARHWEEHCTWCHGGGVVAAGAAPDLRASRLPLTLDSLYQVVAQGTLSARGMPRFENLSRDDVRAVQHFIRHKARASLAATKEVAGR